MELCRGLEERCKQRLILVRPELLAPQGRGGRGGGGWFLSASMGWSLLGSGGLISWSMWLIGQP